MLSLTEEQCEGRHKYLVKYLKKNIPNGEYVKFEWMVWLNFL